MKWDFEPGHTAAEFCVRHMMVCWVRGHLKNIQGSIEFDPQDPANASVEAVIDVPGLWSGDKDRDAHLLSGDFLDAENHPKITYRGDLVEVIGESDFVVGGDLSIRGVTQKVALEVRYLGQWPTPWWEDGVNKGPMIRAGFVATTSFNRHAFGVSWNDTFDRGGMVVGDTVGITIDVEALLRP